MTPAHRFRLGGAATACGEAVLGLLALGTVLAPYFWATAAVTLAATQLAARLMQPPGDGPGGGGAKAPEPPPEEPPWWPAFERDLREYVHDRVHAQPQRLTSRR